MSKTKKSKTADKELVLTGKYDGFKEFYDETKESIFSNIVDLFREFKTTRKKTLVLIVKAEIQGLEWDTEFRFTKKETIVLKRDIIPYFEQIEDYEKCNEINNLYLELTK